MLSADWDFASATPTNENGLTLPFMWPEATRIDAEHSVVRFLTEVEPGFVFIEGYAILRPDDIGETPSSSGDFSKFEEPAAEYECSRFQVNSCMRAGPDVSVEIYGIPAEVFELPHLLVFAKWSVDPEEDPEGVAIANWAWHIRQ